MMQDWANWSIETALRRGATYADARVMDIRQRDLPPKTAKSARWSEGEIARNWYPRDRKRLVGLRFHRPADARRRASLRRASGGDRESFIAGARRRDVALAPEKAYVDTWQNPFLKDPFRIPVEKQIGLLLAADAEMQRVKGITLAEGSMTFKRIEQLFVSSIGSSIHQVKMHSGAGIVATSFAGSEIQKRSYPNSFGGQHALQGYELVESFDLVGNAGRIAEEAVELHSAAQCPEQTGTIILGGSQLGLADSRIDRPSHRTRSRAGQGSQLRRA